MLCATWRCILIDSIIQEIIQVFVWQFIIFRLGFDEFAKTFDMLFIRFDDGITYFGYNFNLFIELFLSSFQLFLGL